MTTRHEHTTMLDKLKNGISSIYKCDGNLEASEYDKKIWRMEWMPKQIVVRLTWYIAFGAQVLPPVARLLSHNHSVIDSAAVAEFRRFGLWMILAGVPGFVILVLGRRMKSRALGWLSGAVLLTGCGLIDGKWGLVVIAVAVIAVAQGLRPEYGTLEDALMLWEPNNETSAYYKFAEAKRAAKLL